MSLSKNLHFLSRQIRLALSLEEAQKAIKDEIGVPSQVGGPLGELSFKVMSPRDPEKREELEDSLLNLGKKLEDAWPHAKIDFLNPPGYYRMTIKNIPEQMEEAQSQLQESVDLLLNVIQDTSSGFKNTKSEIKDNRIVLKGTMGGSKLYLSIFLGADTDITIQKGDLLMYLRKPKLEDLYDPSYWSTVGKLLDLAGDDDSIKYDQDIQVLYKTIWPGDSNKEYYDPEFPIEGFMVRFTREADDTIRVVMFKNSNYLRYYLKGDIDTDSREMYEILDLFKKLI